jgi:pyrroloquinoline quinone biosynthesis protein E
LDIAKEITELDTDTWLKVIREARKMGAAQLGFSGGEPLVRKDLECLIKEGRREGYYTNLITSGIGMDGDRIAAFREAGLDHIQISFQASSAVLNDTIAGSNKAFTQKLAMAKEVKRQGYPMVLNFVLTRENIDQLEQMLLLAFELKADYVELANAQYYGWAFHNRLQLLPTQVQVEKAEAVSQRYREKWGRNIKIIFVVPDYYEKRPKACMNGWGSIFLTITPDGTALPCHSAKQLPIEFPNVKDHSIETIWRDSQGFNQYRGDSWMQEPCRSCPEKHKDFGGCRCQAYMLTGDATNADPVCDKSPFHQQIKDSALNASTLQKNQQAPLLRNMPNSRDLIAKE